MCQCSAAAMCEPMIDKRCMISSLLPVYRWCMPTINVLFGLSLPLRAMPVLAEGMAVRLLS